MRTTLLFLAVILSLNAAELPFTPPAEYSCQMNITGKDKEASKSHMYQGAGGLRRMEMDSDKGQKAVVIIRPDRKQMIMLMDEKKMAMTMPFDPSHQQRVTDPSTDPNSSWTKAGTETIDGVECTKFEWTSGAKKGAAWVEVKRSVLVRVKEGTDGSQVDFTDYQIGPQKAELFEAPAGYRAMGMPGGR